jgi:hypothetical protein
MPSRYHPIYDGLWDHHSLEGLPFIVKGFFAFLCSNRRLRPSGIYRVTDEQLSADTLLPKSKVRAFIQALVARQRIVRDGAWMFICGYFARQPKQAVLLSGVQNDVSHCGSVPILKAFAEKYPTYRRWSDDRRAMVARPYNEVHTTEQSRAEQNRAEQSSRTVAQPSAQPSGPSRQRAAASNNGSDALTSSRKGRTQPTKDEQLDALAQREGLSRDELKAQADALAKTTAGKNRRS